MALMLKIKYHGKNEFFSSENVLVQESKIYILEV